MYVIQPLGKQSRASFDCGNEPLNVYLRERATQDVKRMLNRVFVLTEEGDNRILGYYTLAATTVAAAALPAHQAKALPRYPIPAALLGKLAVDRLVQGSGHGKRLLANAIRRVQAAGHQIGLHVMAVDPLDAKAEAFYRSCGFVGVHGDRHFLFLRGLV